MYIFIDTCIYLYINTQKHPFIILNLYSYTACSPPIFDTSPLTIFCLAVVVVSVVLAKDATPALPLVPLVTAPQSLGTDLFPVIKRGFLGTKWFLGTYGFVVNSGSNDVQWFFNLQIPFLHLLRKSVTDKSWFLIRDVYGFWQIKWDGTNAPRKLHHFLIFLHSFMILWLWVWTHQKWGFNQRTMGMVVGISIHTCMYTCVYIYIHIDLWAQPI